jgi:hypothetical protein
MEIFSLERELELEESAVRPRQSIERGVKRLTLANDKGRPAPRLIENLSSLPGRERIETLWIEPRSWLVDPLSEPLAEWHPATDPVVRTTRRVASGNGSRCLNHAHSRIAQRIRCRNHAHSRIAQRIRCPKHTSSRIA